VRLSRRDFLAGVALGGAGFAAGCSRHAGSRGNADGWYAWLADTHVAADASATLREQVMAENFRKVVADIMDADDPPRGVIIDGDLALHDGRLDDYETLLKVAAPLRDAGIPLHLALGNHDHRAHFRAAVAAVIPEEESLPDKQVGVVEGPGVRLLLLDSLQKTNVTAGRLGMGQLEWLANQLEAHPATPAIICVHHNLNAEWPSALLDTRELLDLLRPRRQAKAVVFGHTHVWNVQSIDGIHMINLPAIGYRFLPKQPLGWCVFRPARDGCELELRCIGGDRRQDRRRVELRWRSA
jgi:hypothetical protein